MERGDLGTEGQGMDCRCRNSEDGFDEYPWRTLFSH